MFNENFDRDNQLELLKDLADKYPSSIVYKAPIPRKVVVSLAYLDECKLIKWSPDKVNDANPSRIEAEITIAGLDFLAGKYRTPSEDVSGLSSICDSIKKIVIKKIQSEEHDPTEKKNLIERIKNLSADETIKIFLKAVEDGLVSFPDTPQGFQNGVHSPDNPIAIS